jgi:putative Holliday junction resolvase
LTRTAGRVLGVDLGSVRIGLALSDPLGITAQPLLVLPRSGARSVDHHAIVGIAREHDAVRIVVGLPRSLSGKLGPAARAVLQEVDELGECAGPDLPVETYDERLTTVIAQQALADAGVKGRNRKQHVDKVAAAVILRGWLDGPDS